MRSLAPIGLVLCTCYTHERRPHAGRALGTDVPCVKSPFHYDTTAKSLCGGGEATSLQHL